MIIPPRQLFQKLHKEDMGKLAIVVNEGWFQRAMSFALAQLAFEGTEKAKLEGANLFVTALENLASEPLPPMSMPDKSALTSYENT